jgi:exodeoxyribonuclease III
MPIRVVAWNIRQGGGKRCGGIVQALIKLGTDVAVISEYRHNDPWSMAEQLSTAGFSDQVLGADPMRGHAGLLIVSRLPLKTGDLVYRSDMDGHRFAHVTVNEWHLCGAYIPGSEPPRERKPSFWRFLLDEVEPVLRDVPAVVIGDLNTGLHYRDEPGATLVCAAEMAEFEERGWRDGWISRNPLARPPATWWSPQAKTPYRLDHALVSPASPRLRHVDYPERLDDGTPFAGPGGLSDHLPLLSDLP